MRRRGAEGGVESNIGLVFARGPRLDVAAALSFGVGTRTPPALAAGDLVQGIIDLARVKGFTGPYLLAAFPPMGVSAIEDLLRTRFGGAVLGFSLVEGLLV